MARQPWSYGYHFGGLYHYMIVIQSFAKIRSKSLNLEKKKRNKSNDRVDLLSFSETFTQF